MKKTKLTKLLASNPIKIRLLSLIFICCASPMQAEIFDENNKSNIEKPNALQFTVSGTILDDAGQPLPGANVIEKGTTNGTQTDFDGNFSLTLSSRNAVLQVSYIGFVPQEVPVNGNSTVSVTMEVDSQALDEVVVVGYGTQRRSQITGAISSVSAEDLQAIPLARVDQALQGRAAGVFVQNATGAPNSEVRIRIRGSNSINGDNDPLVVIDGAQGASINSVNPNDIESFEVLKDASATSIYGSRGANGVILITTKSGKTNKTTVTYNTYLAANKLRKKRDLLNAGQYAELLNESTEAQGFAQPFTPEEVAGYYANGGTDWQDEIFRTSFSQNHHLNISGGAENVRYNLAGDYLKNEGIVINTGYERWSVRPNITVDVNDKIQVTLNSFFQWSTDKPTQINGFNTSPIFSASIWSPTKPVYLEDGSYSMPGGGVGPNTDFNPVALALEPIRENKNNIFTLNPSVSYEIIDGLVFDGRVTYRATDFENNFYDNQVPQGGVPLNRRAIVTDGRSTYLQNTAQLTYETNFNDVHDLKVTALYETQVENFNQNQINANGFLTDAATWNNLGLAENRQVSSSISRRDLESFMGRINYGYKDRYIITLTGRRDASSVFGANNKSGFFPSGSIAWNVSNENFLKDSNVISNLKFRASYGEVGSQAVGPYTSLAQLQTGSNFSFDGTQTIGVALTNRAPNPNLKWETTAQTDFGIDAEFFNGRFDLTVAYYKKNTRDLLLEIPLAQSSGFRTQLVNIGEVQNKGIELLIGGNIIQSDDFNWRTNFTLTSNDNEVLALAEGQTEQLIGNAGLPGTDNTRWLEVGQPLGLWRGIRYDGVWGTDEAAEAAEIGAVPGDPKLFDADGSGAIDAGDNINIGNAQEDYSFGWDNTFTYKGFDLNVFIQGVQGNQIYNLSRLRTDLPSGTTGATSVDALNRWTPTNQNTDVPTFGSGERFPQTNIGRWLEDGSYIRFKNISLGYSFSPSVLDALKISSFRLYLAGTNLITITDYTGYDPEASTGSDRNAGVDLATYPSQKTYTLGIDVTF